jgi:hypothetical protein
VSRILISQTGLLEKRYLYYLRGLFTLWAHQKVGEVSEKLTDEVKTLKASGVLHKVTITACAVWDTVSALATLTQLPLRQLAFVGNKSPAVLSMHFRHWHWMRIDLSSSRVCGSPKSQRRKMPTQVQGRVVLA